MVTVDRSAEVLARIPAPFALATTPIIYRLGDNGCYQAPRPFQLDPHHSSHNSLVTPFFDRVC
jgi:hypothetical protein